jgi:hypothetical protein
MKRTLPLHLAIIFLAIALLCTAAAQAQYDPVADAVRTLIASYGATGVGECVPDMWYVHTNVDNRMDLRIANENLITFDSNGNIVAVSSRVSTFVRNQP